MLRPEVTQLYKYYTSSNTTLESLRTGGFWFAKPSSFNDPFDCAISASDDAVEESVAHAVTVALRDGLLDPSEVPADGYRATPADALAYKRFQEGLRTIFEKVGLLCLTEVPDDLLMWSHYADSHRGFVLGLERAESSVLGREARPVVYQNDYPRLSSANFDRKTNPSSAEVLWLTKSVHWAYEREWRLISLNGNAMHALDVRITSVIFGMRMPHEARALLRDALSTHDSIRFLEAVRSPTSFRVQIRPAS